MDALVKYDADTIITGSSDGIIRIISILPNRMLGVLGGTEDLPIERLALSHDRATLASVSHESCLRLWDLSHLANESEAEEDGAPGDVSYQVNFSTLVPDDSRGVYQHTVYDANLRSMSQRRIATCIAICPQTSMGRSTCGLPAH